MATQYILFDAYGTLYDVQSVYSALTESCGDKAAVVTVLWRQKQLEYTWLHGLMEDYKDFSVLTRSSLEFALDSVGIKPTAALCEKPMNKFLALDLYPEARHALAALSDYKLAILSNGSPRMLDALVGATGVAPLFVEVISVDQAKTYKPNPKCYALAISTLLTAVDNVLFVSSNGFDIAGAEQFGFKTVWVERGAAMSASDSPVGPVEFYRLMRGGTERLGQQADARVSALTDLPSVLSKFDR